MTRNWSAARAKVDEEGICRVCGHGAGFMPIPVDAAHIIPRSRVKPGPGEDARNICPLCRNCHAAYDQGKLDLLPYLTREEQAYAVELVGLYEAYRRTTNERVVV
jgi:5-methylcytosine-specific restriction endonuclease McrA